MKDIYKDNLSAQSIIRSAIARSNRNKYNEAVHQNTEEIVGEFSDRTSYDTGNEPEPLQEHE